MTYEIVDMDGGDVLGVFASLDAARERARLLVEEHPELIGDVCVVPIGADGERVGELMPAEQHFGIPA